MIILIGERTSKRGRDKNDFRQNMYPYENMKFLLSVLNKKKILEIMILEIMQKQKSLTCDWFWIIYWFIFYEGHRGT